MTKGIHIWSTAPGEKKRGGNPYAPAYFELVCLALSALMWRKLNGPIKFYTDTEAFTWFQLHDLLDIWDGGVDTEALDSIPRSINQEIFWAGSKLFALRAETAPVAMVDTDLIIWKPLEDLLDGPLTVLHREEILDCYIPMECLKKRPGYQFDPQWDWTVKPCNTAFAYFGDDAFKKQYVDKAIDFMTDNSVYPMEMVSQMVFAEQRLLAMEARKESIRINALIKDPFEEDNTLFTHLWGAKQIARSNPEQCEILVRAMMNKIREENAVIYNKLLKLA